jgi:hypothetical protein
LIGVSGWVNTRRNVQQTYVAWRNKKYQDWGFGMNWVAVPSCSEISVQLADRPALQFHTA